MRLAALLALLTAVALLAACREGSPGAPGRLRVVATIAPTGALVQAVAGDLVDLTVLVGAGTDPHDYNLRARDRRAIADADLVFRNGAGIDAFLDEVLEDAETVATLTDVLQLMPGAGHEDREGSDGDLDPHAWHDPENDKTMVTAIAEALAAADSTNADAYRANADSYRARLAEVDAEVRALIESIPPAGRKIVTNHDGFGYFIRRYGLTFVGAVIPSTTTGSEPSARDIADLVDTIEREDVKAIFAESSVDPKVARRVAEDTGAKIIDDLYVDSLGPPGSGADTVDGMLLANARTIAEALR
jgi:ABC-type Zn uptake system ZnuABC Zn-binding protein ZnuA